MNEALIQLLWGTLGTLGFSLFFRVRLRHLPAATLGGALSLICYLPVYHWSESFFFATLAAAALVCFWSEGMARFRKAPANVFLIPGIIPLLPGSALYYAMDGVVNSDMDVLIRKGSETAFTAVGIAGGILLASEVVRLILYVLESRREKGKG